MICTIVVCHPHSLIIKFSVLSTLPDRGTHEYRYQSLIDSWTVVKYRVVEIH